MKLFLAIALFVGAALSNSTHYYAWTPEREYVYRFESKVDFSLPEIRHNQKSGLRLTSVVRVQTKRDYSLLIKFDHPKFLTFNGIQEAEAREEREEPIPRRFMEHLEAPFKVYLRRGVVESFFVAEDEPIEVTNIKKALLANLNMDLSASRRTEIESNRLEIPSEQTLERSPLDQSYFTVREQSLHGDCQTSYNIHEMPAYEAMEIENRMEQLEILRNSQEHLQGGLSQAKLACQGKKYWQITKTRNFDNCVERPVYQKWAGLKAKCDTTKASCKDLMTHVSATNYIACGNDIRDIIIRKSVTENAISAVAMGWKTEETMRNTAKVTMELLEAKQSFTPFRPATAAKELKSLIFEIPEARQERHLSVEEKQQIELETGIKPQLKKPDLRSAPNRFTKVDLSAHEIKQQVVEELTKIAQEVFDNDSCTSKLDVAGRLSYVAKYLRALSFQQLKEIESEIQSRIESRPSEEQKKVLKSLFYDVVAMIGTNPAVMLVKESLRTSTRIEPEMALRLIQTTFENIKTPTEELMRELITLVKETLKQKAHREEWTAVYNMALLRLSNTMFKACIDRSQSVSFPVHMYGYFCQADSRVVEEYLTFLEQELETEQNMRIKLNIITALGKTGTLKSVKILTTKIVSNQQLVPMVRSLAVYSMKRAARMQPVHIKPILLSIIDNAAEDRQVRIAAVAILPFAQPETAELQKIAVRTWLEPSKEVSSFIYSTFKSLSVTEVPELKIIGQKVKPLLSLVKPFEYGIQYSKNINVAQFVEYLNAVITQKWSYVKSKDQMVPVRQHIVGMVYGGAFEVVGPNWTIYSEGMDKWIASLFRYNRQGLKTSRKVTEELSQVVQKLNIEERIQKDPVVFMQNQFMELENEWYLNQAQLIESLDKVAEELENDDSHMFERKTFTYVRSLKLMEAEGYGPSDAGFPLYNSVEVPVVMALKGYGQMVMEERFGLRIPKMLKGKVVPVINVKVESIRGVVSPFTQELISVGVEAAIHMATPLEMSLSQESSQLSLDIKLPEEVSERNEVEAIHMFITPYTVKKNLKMIRPPSKESTMKPVLSGTPLKKADIPIGRMIAMAGKIEYESDAKYNDLWSYVKMIKQHNLHSLYNSFFLPSTVRMSSTRIILDPRQSQTKEITLSLSLMKMTKSQEASSPLKVQSMAGLMVNEAKSAEAEVTDMHHIQEVCKSVYPRNTQGYTNCVFKLSALEAVEETVSQMCRIAPFNGCQRYEQICRNAVHLCEEHYTSTECRRKSETCFKRLLNVQSLHKTMQQLESGSVVSVVLGAQLRSEQGVAHHESQTAFSVGMKKEESSSSSAEIVKLVSDIEVRPARNSQTYEIKLTSRSEIPRVNYRWTKEQVLNEILRLALNAEVQYGYQNRAKETIRMTSEMTKTESQKEAVRRSPEYLRCSMEEQTGKILANVCEFTRHQAASIDEMKTELTLPRSIARHPIFYRIGEALKSLFVAQMWVEESSNTSQETLKLRANVSRTGEEAQFEAEIAGTKYQIRNIRIPYLLKGVFPMSLRNPVGFNILQHITRHQIPASCRIEPQYIWTFDNKTYSYELNNCFHLLFKDCAQQIPVAVLAKNIQGSEKKEVKILSGVTELLMTPESSQMRLKLNVEGQERELLVQPGQVEQVIARSEGSEEVIMEVKRYEDNVYLVIFPQESLWVLFDGKRIEISPSQMLKGRTCGLCGDLDHENTADLKTPRKCLMSEPRLAAFSYMLKEPSCQGIPSQMRPQYERELNQCVRETTIPTPLERLVEKLAQRPSQLPRPLISQHIVEKRDSQVCISVQKLKTCSKISQGESEEPRPESLRRQMVQFVCLDAPSRQAQQLEQRAKAGESLIMNFAGKSIAYSKIQYEPTACRRQSNQI